MTLVPPIVIAEGSHLFLFRSRGDAERAVEARDVAGGAYRAWDATGRVLRLDIGDAVCIDLAAVRLSAPAASEERPDELEQVLRAYLAAIDAPPAASASLSGLLARAVAVAGYSR